MLTYETCHVLLVDDEPAMLDEIQARLAESTPQTNSAYPLFEIQYASCLADAFSLLDASIGQSDAESDETTINVVLLDLSLPDSNGVDTLEHLRNDYPGIPVIILTGNDDDVVAVKAIELGAHGFLLKENIESNLLAYALLLAAKRHSQLKAVPQQSVESELADLDRLASKVRTSVITARLFDSGSLQSTVPDVFNQLVEEYKAIIDQVLEQRIIRVIYPTSENLRKLAEQLGFVKATPRDVVELHAAAIHQLTANVNVQKGRAYSAEGRLVVLELMGYLANYYRKYFIGLGKINLISEMQSADSTDPPP